jgi:putative FmdB family regulatory protein
MPVYEYQCKDCKNIIEEFWQSISEAEEQEAEFLRLAFCPQCNSKNLVRIVSGSMVQFQGEGWSNKSILGGTPLKENSTESIKEHAQRIKEESRNRTSKDFYGDINV